MHAPSSDRNRQPVQAHRYADRAAVLGHVGLGTRPRVSAHTGLSGFVRRRACVYALRWVELPGAAAGPAGGGVRGRRVRGSALRSAVPAGASFWTTIANSRSGPGGSSRRSRRPAPLCSTCAGVPRRTLLWRAHGLDAGRDRARLCGRAFASLLPAASTPALFVSGTHDGFGSIAELESAIALIPARTQLLEVKGAGHELLNKASRETMPWLVAEAFLMFAGVRS